MRRSITRGSHQSHPSVTASTQSWVQYNHTHNLLPPEDSTPIHSPAQRPYRPLPEQPQQFHQPRQLFQYAGTHETIPEEEYTNGHANVDGFGVSYSNYQPEQPAGDLAPMPVPSSPPNEHLRPNHIRGRSFVGGFFSGLKRVMGGGSGKQKLKRKGTFGTDTEGLGTSPTITATGMARQNTLPRYLSNPSIGPSNPQFAHRLSRVPDGQSSGPDTPPPAFQFRDNPAGPQYPIVTVTPASDGIAEEAQADFYEGPPADHETFVPTNDTTDLPHRINDRVTVIGYGTESQAATMPTPARPAPARLPTPGPRVSYQAQLPTRATPGQVQTESVGHVSAIPPATSPFQRRRVPNVRPARNEITSGQSPSNYTISAAPSYYDPSFSSDLTPVEKFFKGLYNLPWIAHDRVTVDYRPGDSERAKSKVKAMKKPKPMASWYRNVMSRSRRNSLDLLSSGSSSPVTSYGNPLSPLGSPLSAEDAPHHHHHHHHTYYTWGPKPKRHHRKHRRHTTSTTTTEPIAHQTQAPHRNGSPVQPALYPYVYPSYPYVYPYTGYPPPMNTMPDTQTQVRGPRSHRRPKTSKYPHGYAQYQPMPITMPPMTTMPPHTMPPHVPPVFIIAPSPPGSHNGSDGNNLNNITQPFMQMQQQQQAGPSTSSGQQQQQQPMQLSSGVVMHYVPGGYTYDALPKNSAMISPPLTPQRPAPRPS